MSENRTEGSDALTILREFERTRYAFRDVFEFVACKGVFPIDAETRVPLCECHRQAASPDAAAGQPGVQEARSSNDVALGWMKRDEDALPASVGDSGGPG